jgi:DNA primase
MEGAKLLIQVIEYYHESLLESPEALDYLKRRGIGSEEAIRTITIGFANLRLSYRLPEKNRVDGAALPRVLMSQVTGCGRGSSRQASR